MRALLLFKISKTYISFGDLRNKSVQLKLSFVSTATYIYSENSQRAKFIRVVENIYYLSARKSH